MIWVCKLRIEESHDSLKDQVIHSLKWVVVGKVISQTVRWIITFWVIRLLMPEDYGIVSLADVFFGFLTMVIGPIVAPAIIQYQNISKVEYRQLFGFAIIVYSAAFIIQMSSADWVGEFFNSDNVARILKVNAWCFPVLLLSVIPTAMLNKEMRFKYTSLVLMFANSVAAIATLIMALRGFGFWSLIYGEIISICISSLLHFLGKPILLLPDFRINRILPYLRFGAYGIVSAILSYIFLTMDVAIGGRMMTTAEVGVFAVALQFGLMPQKKLLPLIKQVAFPAFAKIQEQKKRIAYYTIKAQQMTFLITIPIFWGLASVIELVIPLVIGQTWTNAIIPTKILLLVMPLRFSSELFGPALFSQKKLQHILVNLLLMICVMLISILIGVNYGAVGLAYSWLFGFPVVFCLLVYRNCKTLNIQQRNFLAVLPIPTVAGLLMLGGVHFLKLYSFGPIIFDLFVQILVGAVIYLSFIWVFDKNSATETILLLKSGR